jgi:hypothetical protein
MTSQSRRSYSARHFLTNGIIINISWAYLAKIYYLIDIWTHMALRTGNITLKFSMMCSRFTECWNKSAVIVKKTE